MNGNAKKRQYGSMKRSAVWLIVSALLTIALCVSAYARYEAADKLNILKEVPYGVSMQNSKVTSSKELAYTFLGTYKDAVLAIDSEGNQVWSSPTNGSVEGIEYDPLRELVIAGAQGRSIHIFNARDGSEVKSIHTGGRVYDIDYQPESGQILVSAPSNAAKGLLFVYDLDGNELLKLSTRPARGCAFSPDGRFIYYGDARANVYKLSADGEEIASARIDDEIYALDISRDTGDVVVISDEGTVARFDAELNAKFAVTLVGDGRAIAITAAGNLIGAGTREGDVYLLSAEGVTQYTTRLPDAVSQIVIDEGAGYIVPLSSTLYALDVTAAEGFATYTRISALASRLNIALPLLLALSLALSFGKSRSRVLAFFAALHRHRVAYLLLLPSFAIIFVFQYYPIGQAFYFAFTDWNQATTTMRDVNFIGLGNFAKMIHEGYFLLGVKNMLIMMGFAFLKLLMPLLLAELVFAMSGNRRRYWFRFLLVLPMVVPAVVSTLMWKNIYDPTIGLINQLLQLIGRPDLQRSWLGSPTTALGSIIFMGFPWVNSFAFLVFYGGLINIPGDLFEAARVDGSTPIWNLMRIHLPLITPQIKMIVILTFIGSVQDYGGVLLLTNGGPGYATYVPGYEMYLNATLLGQYGYACALGLVLFLAILAGTILNLKIKTEESLG